MDGNSSSWLGSEKNTSVDAPLMAPKWKNQPPMCAKLTLDNLVLPFSSSSVKYLSQIENGKSPIV
jgi:hypothetical protein